MINRLSRLKKQPSKQPLLQPQAESYTAVLETLLADYSVQLERLNYVYQFQRKNTASSEFQKKVFEGVMAVDSICTKIQQQYLKELRVLEQRDLPPRTKKTLLASLRLRLKEMVDKKSQATERIRSGVKAGCRRQILLVAPQCSEAEVEQALNNPQKFNEMVSGRIFRGNRRLNYALEDMLEKKLEMELLESKIKENQRLLREIALLADAQGERLDRLEDDLARAQDYVREGLAEVEERSRKEEVSGKAVCGVVLLAVLLLAGFVALMWKSIAL